MLEINSNIKLSDNREYVVEDELLYNGQIYYVLSTQEDDFQEKILIECVEYEGDKYIQVVEDDNVYIALEDKINSK